MDKYTGSSDYSLFRKQLLHHAELLGWDETTKGSQLSQLLSEKALEVLRFLQPNQLQNFNALDSALQRRFGTVNDVNVYKAKLRNLKQKGNQTLEAYATDVEDAVRGAYPHLPEQLLQQQMVGAFIDGLSDATMALLLVRESHLTLDAVLKSARVQPPQMLDKTACVGRVQEDTSDLAGKGDSRVTSDVNSVTETVTSLVKLLQQTSMAKRERERGRERERKAFCFYCRQSSHRKASCPKLEAKRAKEAGQQEAEATAKQQEL